MPNTKFKKRIHYVMIVNFLITVILLSYATSTMKSDYFDAIGRRAMTFSMVMADHLKLSDRDLNNLVEMDFNDLLDSDINAEFESMVRRYMPAAEIKYVYVLHHLSPDDVKYHITADEASYYAAPEGTPLDTVYLIDAVIDENTRLEDTDYAGYVDHDRYTFLHDEIASVYYAKTSSFKFYSDEWGTYITGFAPLYTTEGTYVGMLASDVYMDEYIGLIGRRLIIIFLFGVVIMTLIFALIAGFRRINKIEGVIDDLKARAYKDDMTGFYNKRTFSEQEYEYNAITQANQDPVSIIMIDIDHFKHINDTYGHPIGDKVITQVAKIIKPHLHERDYPFRYGGDEFMLLCVDRSRASAYGLAETILTEVQNADFDSVNEHITLSIGLAFAIPDDYFKVSDLIHKADEMLYHSKENGRNQISMKD